MNPTSDRHFDVSKCLVLVASQPPATGIRGRVWDLDSGELAEPMQVVPSRHGTCAHCGASEGQMLRVLHEGRALAFCDSGHCAVSVSAIVAFRPLAAYPGESEIEFMGTHQCPCGRTHIVGGPRDRWTLGYCPNSGRAVLAQPDLAALESAVEVAS